MTFKTKIVPLGDAALLIQLGDEIDITVNQRVHALAAILDASPIEGFIETVPAYGTLILHYDPLILTYAKISKWVRATLDQVEDTKLSKPRQIRVPVRYGGEFGVDLELVASNCGLSVEDVIRLHSARTYTVYMMGFTPGFPYMGKLDGAIVTPRLLTPRTRVPAGTVAIAGSQTGIYPIASPGGWRLIGWTSLEIFDLDAESPFLFSPGDEVKLVIEK
jgi:KipI family sensor histidine kinase inhibitor